MPEDPLSAVVVAAVMALKFGLPILYLRRPFEAGWTCRVVDGIDGDILVPAGLAEPTYQLIDKVADYWSYIFILAWGWRLPIRREVTATFALRTVGQFLFFGTRNELTLFFFPNLLEPLFLIYATLVRFTDREKAWQTYQNHRLLIWSLIVAYKMQDEWVTHVGNVDRTEAVRSLWQRATGR